MQAVCKNRSMTCGAHPSAKMLTKGRGIGKSEGVISTRRFVRVLQIQAECLFFGLLRVCDG